MVACAFSFCVNYSISVSRFCRFSSCTLYLLLILMKAVLNYLKRIAKQINKTIIFMALLFTYSIICIYHLFVKVKSQRWYKYNKKITLEYTKHLW